MKKCPYCGKVYPDEARVCAIDAHELVAGAPAPTPPAATYTLPLRIRGRPGFGTLLGLREVSPGLTIAKEGLTYHPGRIPVLIEWGAIARMQISRRTLNFTTTNAEIHVYLRRPAESRAIVDVRGLEVEPGRIFAIVEACWKKLALQPVDCRPPDSAASDWLFPIQIRLSTDSSEEAVTFGATILGAFLLCCLVGGALAAAACSPGGIIGAAFLGFGWARLRDRRPKLNITKEGLTYHRGGPPRFIKWSNITGLESHFSSGGLRSVARLYVATRECKTRFTMNILGLDRSPAMIYQIVCSLAQA